MRISPTGYPFLLIVLPPLVVAMPRMEEFDQPLRLQPSIRMTKRDSENSPKEGVSMFNGVVAHLGDYSGEGESRHRNKRIPSIPTVVDEEVIRHDERRTTMAMDDYDESEEEEHTAQRQSRALASSITQGAPTRFLKNKLLDNLNKYFVEGADELEILSPEAKEQTEAAFNSIGPSAPSNQFAWNPPALAPEPEWKPPRAVAPQQPTPNPWLAWTTHSPFLMALHKNNVFQQEQRDPFQSRAPTHPPVMPTLVHIPQGNLLLPMHAPPNQGEPFPSPLFPRLHPQTLPPPPTSATSGPSLSDGMSPLHRRSFPDAHEGDIRKEHKQAMFEARERLVREPINTRQRSDALSKDSINTIRKWRTRIYKALKKHDGGATKHPPRTRMNQTNTSGETVDLKDLIEDPDLNVMHSRDRAERRIRTNGRIDEKRPLGTERSGYGYTTRAPKGLTTRSVVYLPAPSPTLPPIYYGSNEMQHSSFPTLNPHDGHSIPYGGGVTREYTVTMHPPTPITSSLPTLPPFVSPPPLPDYDYQHTETTRAFTPQGRREPVTAITMRGVRCADNEMCDEKEREGGEGGDNEINEDKCNSMRLKKLIEDNIVARDAEASKRAVQSMAEESFGRYFDAVCGTGFFSYIAHTDEFCQASAGGVNCYVFSPVCGGIGDEPFRRHRKRSTSALNKN